MANTYQLIASSTLTTTATTVTFSAIPSTYKDIVIKASIRGDVNTGAFDLQARLTFNGSTASNYNRQWLYGNGTTVSANNNTSTANLETTALNSNTSTANTFSYYEVYIPNYAGTRAKYLSLNAAAETNATLAYIDTNGGLWSLTNAITSLTLTANTNNFVSGSSFFLYGIKNS